MLDIDADLGREEPQGAVEVRAELDPLLPEPAQLGQAEDLEAAGVREDGPIPGHEPMEPAHVTHQLVAGSQEQMVCVGENDLGARRAEIVGIETLDGSLRGDRHERRSLDLTMRRHEPSQTGRPLALPQREAYRRCHRMSMASPYE